MHFMDMFYLYTRKKLKKTGNFTQGPVLDPAERSSVRFGPISATRVGVAKNKHKSSQ